jgi:hypothetical protein
MRRIPGCGAALGGSARGAPQAPRWRPATLGRSLLGGGRAGPGPAGQAGAVPLTEEDIAALPESGRGIDIMRACVDDVSMTTSGPEHRTVVSLQKRLAWRPGAPFGAAPDDEFHDGELADVG